MIDLKELELNLSDEKIIQLVQELGADRYEEHKDYIIFPTICHNEDCDCAKMKLYYYKKNKKFHCYTDCGENFNIYELYKKRYDLLNVNYNFYTDIVLKIATGEHITEKQNDMFGLYYKPIESIGNHEIKVDIPIYREEILNIFNFYPTPEWIEDGISVESMKRYNIKYSISQNKIIIPHYNIDGQLIGIRGRALNEEDIAMGKYMPVQIEGKMYAHPLGYNLYGLNLNKDNIKRKKIAIVFEGEKSVLLYDTFFGNENNIAVAVCGSSLSRYQVELLKKAGAEKIIIAFDSPTINNPQENQKLYKKIEKICKKYSTIMSMGFIIDLNRILGNKDSPIDKGKEIFLKLIKNVQWII